MAERGWQEKHRKYSRNKKSKTLQDETFEQG